MSDEVEQGRCDAPADVMCDPARRAALRAIARYSGAAAATLTVLSAEEVLAKQPCSTHPNPKPEPGPGQNCDPGPPEVLIFNGDGTETPGGPGNGNGNGWGNSGW